jgi:hypothetical protein
MSQFDDIISSGDALIFDHSGDAASCRAAGTGTATDATVVLVENGSRDEDRNGDRYRVRMAEIVIRRSEFVAVPTDTITVGSDIWTVTAQVARDANAITVAAECFALLQQSADGYQAVG